MPYLKVIETTQTWTCPKTAEYKIIAVAGGSGGNIYAGGTNYDWYKGSPGGVTSFGSLLTASGIGPSGGSAGNSYCGGGGGGYTFLDYGGSGGGSNNSPVKNGGGAAFAYGATLPVGFRSGSPHHTQSGAGYGAGGGGGLGAGGAGGKLNIAMVTMTQGTQIPCTIGAGGAGAVYPTDGSCGAVGNDGVIVIQEV